MLLTENETPDRRSVYMRVEGQHDEYCIGTVPTRPDGSVPVAEMIQFLRDAADALLNMAAEEAARQPRHATKDSPT